MDLLDGRVARLMKATSQFGVEFDSLADVVSFCVAPAFLVYSFALKDLSRPAWFGAFLFVICGALRLARFNVQTGTVDRRFFIGLSTPAAAGVIASSVALLGDEPPERWEQIALAAASGVLALLMVSTFRYWSFKEVDFVRRRPVQTLLVVVLAIMIVATKHDVFLFALFTGYAVSGPVRRLLVGRSSRRRPSWPPRNRRRRPYGSRHRLRHDAAGRRAGARLLHEHDGEARDGPAAGPAPGRRHRGRLPDLVGRGLRGHPRGGPPGGHPGQRAVDLRPLARRPGRHRPLLGSGEVRT